jgi:hypothetical protein
MEQTKPTGETTMKTTPEKIAQLRRLHAESTMVAGPHYRKAACEELPGLLDDLEAAQAQVKVLREALVKISNHRPGIGGDGQIARTALAATGQ